ncbi:hypothetical protein KXQ82_03670 [Mucilaginibacter sp. HMF5004]|uniref:hypothetical protein n=1 Tax=Mucilaginibacter rivuli TaxID=2857527 RepID=UPI001C5F23EE|nr:hypothetical protein [Mucilaginibacter rivuli]MBW4888792.1 hypothetical protein [Mucilaginibacter rivuli]
MNSSKKYPELNDDGADRDRTLKDSLGETTDINNLNYNKAEGSYEFDVKSDNPDYDHPDPYNTAVKDGGDSISSYDESNPLAVDEYIKDESLETDIDNLGMHIENEDELEPDPIDRILAHTPEDDRDDLDEEGYPKNDMPIR